MKLIISAVVAVCLMAAVSAQTIFTKGAHFVCVNGTLAPTEATQKSLAKCHDPEVYGEGEGKKHPNCAAFCTVAAIDCLGPDGLPKLNLFNRLVDEEFPESLHELAHNHKKLCFEKHGNFDLTDEKCVNSAAFGTCVWSIRPKLVC